jgi:excisionase family DNA binding protein
METGSEFLRIPEVARRLGLSPSRTYKLAKEGVIPILHHGRNGRGLRVPRQAFEAWLAALNAEALAHIAFMEAVEVQRETR